MCGREAVHLAPHLNEADFDALLAAAVQVPSGDAHRHNNSHFSHVFPSDMQMQQGFGKKTSKTSLVQLGPKLVQSSQLLKQT